MSPVDCHVTVGDTRCVHSVRTLGAAGPVGRSPCRARDRARLRRRSRLDREHLRRPSCSGRRGQRAHAAAGPGGCTQGGRAADQRSERPPSAGGVLGRPGRSAVAGPRDRGNEGDRPRAGGRCDGGAVRRRDGDDDAQRPRRRGRDQGARGLADHLGRHVHERHPARRHARRVHPRHRDVARALRGHAVRVRRGGRGSHRGSRAEGRGAAGSATGPVVEADLQRDRQLRRGADRASARPAFRGRGKPRPTSAISSTTSSTRARRSPPQPASSSTTTRGR